MPWNPEFNALGVRAHRSGLRGRGGAPGLRPLSWWCSARATASPSAAADHIEGPTDALDVLLLGGLPIREPIVHYGPFVMNTKREIANAIDDFNAGRMGTMPAVDLG